MGFITPKRGYEVFCSSDTLYNLPDHVTSSNILVSNLQIQI